MKRQFYRLMKEYNEAHEKLVFIGASHPDEHEEIKRWYRKAKQNLYRFVSNNIPKKRYPNFEYASKDYDNP